MEVDRSLVLCVSGQFLLVLVGRVYGCFVGLDCVIGCCCMMDGLLFEGGFEGISGFFLRERGRG